LADSNRCESVLKMKIHLRSLPHIYPGHFMNKTISHPLLGDLSLQAGPENLMVWKGEVMALQEKVAFYIMIHDTEDLHKAKVSFIASVIQNPVFYINTARNFVLQELRQNPARFGVTPENFSLNNFLLSDPEFNFYEDEEWLFRFSECNHPLFEPYGLLVLFQGHQAVRCEEISDPEVLD
jgi:hypothetical protein